MVGGRAVRVETALVIGAPRARVWSALVDLERYAEWNHHIVGARGEVADGAFLDLAMNLAPGHHTPVTVRVTEFRVPEVLEWRWEHEVPGLFSVCHRFELAVVDAGTHLRNEVELGGTLAEATSELLRQTMTERFVAMNDDLATYVGAPPARRKPVIGTNEPWPKKRD
ncbi:MAG TPA: SRPBCC domain-containing protein [Acidimicrobiales bacterium]|nr:SRPBCC domain-containing protein [Acidimicrobiales bacterium]